MANEIQVITRVGFDVVEELTAAKVIEIRKLRSQGKSMYGLAQRFEVSNTTIRDIVLNKIWKWV